MAEYQLGAMESKFADLVWDHAPVSTTELVKLCGAELNWKRTTTYTVLKRDRHRLAGTEGILRPAKPAVRGQVLSGLAACFPGGFHRRTQADSVGGCRAARHD